MGVGTVVLKTKQTKDNVEENSWVPQDHRARAFRGCQWQYHIVESDPVSRAERRCCVQ